MRLLPFLFFPLFAALAPAEVTVTIDETFPLAADGEVLVDNVNGPVTVLGWDRPEVRVQAEKRARDEADVQALDVRIEAAADRIAIRTAYLKKGKTWLSKFTNRGEVRYTLTVPRTARLREIETVNGSIEIEGVHQRVNASSVNGTIRARDLRHEVELETVNGAITAAIARIGDKQDVRVKTINGAIEITLPADADCEVAADTVNGRIRNDFGLEGGQSSWIGRELRGRLGEGGGRVTLETVNGGIAILKAATP